MRILLKVCLLFILNGFIIQVSSQAETLNWSAMVGPQNPSVLQTHLDLSAGHYSLTVTNATKGVLVQGSTLVAQWPDQSQFTFTGGNLDVYFTVSDTANVVNVQYTLTPDVGDPIVGTLLYTPANTAQVELPVTTDASQADITVRDLGSMGLIGYPLSTATGNVTTTTDTGDTQVSTLSDYTGNEVSASVTVNPGAVLTVTGQVLADLGIIGWQTTVNGNTVTGSQIIKSKTSTLDLKRLGTFKLIADSKIKAWVTVPDVATETTKNGVSVLIVPYGSGTGSVRFDSFPSDSADLAAGMYEVFIKANAQSDPVIVEIVSDDSTPKVRYQYLSGIADFNGHVLADLSTTRLSEYNVNFNDEGYAAPTFIIGYTDATWSEVFRVSSDYPNVAFTAPANKVHIIAYQQELQPTLKRDIVITDAGGSIAYSAFLLQKSMQLIFPAQNFQPGSMTLTTSTYQFPDSRLTHVEVFGWDENGNVQLGFGCDTADTQCLVPYNFDLADNTNLFFTFDGVPTTSAGLLGVTIDYQPSNTADQGTSPQNSGKPDTSSNNSSSNVSSSGSGGGGQLAPWLILVLICFNVRRRYTYK